MFENYFKLFDIEENITIDQNILKRKYFSLQRQYHPDTGKSDNDKYISDINYAYETLRYDLSRYEYILTLHGFFIADEKNNIKPNTEILFQILNYREILEEATDLDKISTLKKQIQQDYDNSHDQLTKAFEREDFEIMGYHVINLKYYTKLFKEIEVKYADNSNK